MLPFADRVEAGQLLAAKLKNYERDPEVVVLALPRGGVPVAFEVAERLHVMLDIIVVRKVGVPWQPELAMGAVASGGTTVLDHAFIKALKLRSEYVEHLVAEQEKEVKSRDARLRGDNPPYPVSGRTVILVDDGAATGSTMLAAAEAVRKQHPQRVVIAVPLASKEAILAFESEADECVCFATPEPFYSVGQWYESFRQISDEEVRALLAASRADTSKQPLSIQGAA